MLTFSLKIEPAHVLKYSIYLQDYRVIQSSRLHVDHS